MAVVDNIGQRHYYHADATGTIVALSGETGLVEERYATGPFGAVDAASGLANYRFAGRPYDMETGLYYNRARYYHPGLGRFLSPAPSGYADGLSLYAYAANDPVNLADPSGLFAQATKESVVAGFSVVSTTASKAGAAATRSLASGANQAAGFLERNETAVAVGVTAAGFVVDVLTIPSGEGLLIAAGASIGVRGAAAGLRAFAKSSIKGKGLTTPKKYFGNKTYKQTEKALNKKLGSPKGGGKNNKSFYNEKTKRTYNLHKDPSHRSGKAHIDIRKRNLPSNYYKDKPFFLKE